MVGTIVTTRLIGTTVKKSSDSLVVEAVPETERLPNEVVLEIGQWYWINGEKGPWIACITEIGSNYAELTSPGRSSIRIHFDEFDEYCTVEPNAEAIFKDNVDRYQGQVRTLMGEIQALTAQLGVAPRAELGVEGTEQTQALVVAHGTKNVKKYKVALIKAKKKTLPDLFERVEEAHSKLRKWMKASLVPMYAETDQLKVQTKKIEDRIFTVELYAGLVEELVKVRDGKPADSNEKLHLHQRRHYMDEECLVDYKAGGMEFKNIGAFDRWLKKKKNLKRVLPFPRSIVAFQVRRHNKEREFASISAYINFLFRYADEDESTFLYLRNGEQLWRLATEIDFGEQLFPDRALSTTLGEGEIWFRHFCSSIDDMISGAAYEGLLEDQREKKRKYKAEMREWKKLSKKERKGRCAPRYRSDYSQWEKLTPESVYYDDACKKIAQEAMQHNRVAVVLQGILDRSPALHPHPPWQLWTPLGFESALELYYDQTRALSSGDVPDFEAYRARLNASLKKGSLVVGQQEAWERHMAKKKNEQHYSTHYTPYGNPGPGLIAKVVRLSRDKKKATFEWMRERMTYRAWGNDDDIKTRFTCSTSLLLNVGVYRLKDYLQFYADPRTRAEYLKWAPLLLAAENHLAKLAKKAKERK